MSGISASCRSIAAIVRSAVTTTYLMLLLMITVTHQGKTEKRLLNKLSQHYNKLERPVFNETDPLVVQFGLTLQQIIDVDEKNQILKSNMWLNLVWTDYSLTWNESDYDGITSVRIPPGNIWKPDIFMYNSADEDIDSTFPTNVVVRSNGECLWVPPGLFMSTCKIDITWFPFDDQNCPMKFGSWTYDSSGIDLRPKEETADISSFITNGEWELLGVPAKRNIIQYDCCPEKYIDITYIVRIQRRKLYYIFNLVVPCLMMSCLSLLVFSMPPDAGEKITCGVTILLSLTVFLQLVAETMPPTSDAVPLIGIYFACIMLMCSLSMVFTVLVLNFHHRNPDTHTMPPWVKKGICEWLAKILGMNRPFDPTLMSTNKQKDDVSTETRKTSSSSSFRKSMKKSSPINSNVLQQRSSRSLLANVLDLEDDLLMLSLDQAKARVGTLGRGRVAEANNSSRNVSRTSSLRVTSMNSAAQAVIGGDVDGRIVGVDVVPDVQHPSLQQRKFRTNSSSANAAATGKCSCCQCPECCTSECPLYSEMNGMAPGYHQLGIGASCGPGEVGSGASSGVELVCRPTHSSASTWQETETTRQISIIGGSVSAAAAAADSSAPLQSDGGQVQSLSSSLECSLLADVLVEVRYLAGRVQREAETQQACSDWKFAAMVVDRLCLWMFSIFTVVSTGAILLSAPHVVV